MPSTKVNAIFDSNILKNEPNRDCQGDTMAGIFTGSMSMSAIMQFHLPLIEEIAITAAKLYFFVQNRGHNIEIGATLCDYHESMAGITYNTYYGYVYQTEVLESDDKYVCDSKYVNYNKWESIDITNLVIGHLGEQYYSLILKADEIDTTVGASGSSTLIGNIEGGYTPYIYIEYEYATPFKPKILYPDGDSVSNSGQMVFRWEYLSSGSTPQAKFDLQWKMQADTEWITVSQTTSNTYYSMDASAFTNGIVEWKVRTYNKNNMVSDWSESQFVVIGKPGNPVVTGVKNSAITAVSWAANKTEEAAARIRIKKNGVVIYDSGVIPAGIDDTHKINGMFDNGNYVVLLSISNMYGMWSDEISYSFSISQGKPPVPVLTVAGMGDYVHLEYTAVANAEYFIYRSDGGDFIPIGRTKETHYDDYAVMSGKRYQYFVRVYTGSYNDSAVKDVYIKYDGYYVSDVNDMGKRVKLFYHDSEHYVPFERRKSNNSVLVKYSGREKPVRESGIHKSSTVTIEAFITRKDDELFWQIYGNNSILCIRGKELLLYGDVSAPSEVMTFFNRGYLLGLTFEEADYREQVRFDE